VKFVVAQRIVSLSEINQPDTEMALAFSAYLDAVRLSPGATGMSTDTGMACRVRRGI
jgi:hypothetical protein